MQPVSAGFLEALAAPQTVQVRGRVTKGGQPLAPSLPIVGGSVEVNSSQITRRRLTMLLAPTMSTGTYDEVATLGRSWQDPIAPYGQEITCEWGLTYTDGTTEWIRLGTFRIDDVDGSLLGDSVVQVRGVSREALVADARFWTPQTRSSPSAQSLIAALIREAAGPSIEVLAAASMDRRVPPTTFDEDRWRAVADLAESIGAVVYADAFGRFVIADLPTVDTAPVWRVAAGPGGVLVGAAAASSRADVYNAVTVESSNTASDVPPVNATVVDAGPNSPTRYGFLADGAWGKRVRSMSLPTIASAEQARVIATRNLAKFAGAAATLDVSAVPNPALEAGDVVEVITDPARPAETVRRHVVDSLTIPLTAGGAFTMRTRDVADVHAEAASE